MVRLMKPSELVDLVQKRNGNDDICGSYLVVDASVIVEIAISAIQSTG